VAGDPRGRSGHASSKSNRSSLRSMPTMRRLFTSRASSDEQWHPDRILHPRSSWRELRVALQLASRRGPVAEKRDRILQPRVAEFAATVKRPFRQREAPPARPAASRARARPLLRRGGHRGGRQRDRPVRRDFRACPRVKAIALENGLSETAEGNLAELRPRRHGGIQRSTPRRRGERAYAHVGHRAHLALDLPQVADAPSGLRRHGAARPERSACARGGSSSTTIAARCRTPASHDPPHRREGFARTWKRTAFRPAARSRGASSPDVPVAGRR
jgi:hypothetical protein